MEQGKHEPQGHGEAPDREQGQGKADHRSENRHSHPYGELHHAQPGSRGFDLAQAAVEELRGAGFKPEFDRDVQGQVSEIEGDVAHWSDAKGAADLRALDAALDTIFASSAVWRGLVIDMRLSHGGASALGLAIASRLATAPYTAYAIVARRDPNDATLMTAPQLAMVVPSARPGWHGPVVEIGRASRRERVSCCV